MKFLGGPEQGKVVQDLEAGKLASPPQKIVTALAAALRISDTEITACREAGAAVAGAGAGAPKKLMEVIARSYILARPNASAMDRKAFIALKATEYRAIRASFAKMSRDGAKRRMMADAVRKQLDNGDVGGAEAFLERAERIRQPDSMVAALRRERGAVALIAGDAHRAAQTFEEAAQILDGISPDGAAEMRDMAGGALYQHALVTGAGRELPAPFFRKVLKARTKAKDREKWAKAENNLANAVHAHAFSATKQACVTLLPEAIDGYRAALTVFSKSVKPSRWALALCNLSEALANLARFVDKDDAGEMLDEAAECLRSALTARSRGAHPALWGTTHHDLARVLVRRAEMLGPKGAPLLAEAAAAEQETIGVLTVEAAPHHRAAACNSLANIQRQRAAYADDAERAILLSQAVQAAQGALQIYTKTDDPGPWASVQNNLALIYKDQARMLDRASSATAYGEAAAACRAALEVRTKAASARGWATLQTTLSKVLCGEAATTGGAEGGRLAAQAVAAAEAAAQVYTKEAAPRYWAEGRNLIAIALETRADLDPSCAEASLEKAVEALREAAQSMGQETPLDMQHAIKRNLARLEARVGPRIASRAA